jgi:hypothetical protein
VARQKRTTKSLAQRIDVNYLQRPHPFRRWRMICAIAVPSVALLWGGGVALGKHSRPASPGPVSASHAVFGSRCEVCHQSRAGFFHREVKDDKCLACHDGPVHHATQAFTPACASCHTEHRAAMRLASVGDADCVRCHAQLTVRSGRPQFEPAIRNFVGGHPEFRATRAGFRDPGTIKLNHKVHMKPGLKGPNGPVDMQCDDCHRAQGDDRPWPYAGPVTTPTSAQVVPAALTGSIPPHPRPGARMSPIQYKQQCAACHTLQFDRRFNQEAPHDTPDVIHRFLLQKYSDYIAQHPGEVRSTGLNLQRIPQQASPVIARNRDEWIQLRVAEAETLLWQKTCKECHQLRAQQGGLPAVAKSSIPARWFLHANFDHRSHRMLDCLSCHARAASSEETSDVLLPGIAVCQRCHRSQQSPGDNFAEARCFECHSYHNWKDAKPTKGRYTLPQLLGE